MAESTDVVKKFLNLGMHMTRNAFDRVNDISDEEIELVISDLEEREDRPTILTDKVVSQILSSEETIPSEDPGASGCGTVLENEDSIDDRNRRNEKYSEVLEEGEVIIRNGDSDSGKVEILKNITGKSTSEGTVEDFVDLFRDRFEKLRDVLRAREGFTSYTMIENIPRHEGDQINLVGLVNEKRETRKNDAWLVELEDPSGKAVVYVKDSKRNEDIVKDIERTVTDEVIGIKAQVPDDLDSGNRNPLVWGNEIYYPDIPISQARNKNIEEEKNDRSGYAVLLSDLHVGSGEFLPGAFKKFLKWINGSAGNEEQRKIAENVKYVLIAGDLVDGIGVYPGQKKELEIEGIREQYERVADLLSKIPEDIVVIAAPGNHDSVRLAEPQPALYTDVASPLREIDVKLVSNPSLLSIEGMKFLMYHGMGFDDLIAADPELDRENMEKPLVEVMRRRHLAPIYGEPMGGRTPLAPEHEDHLVIDEVPDVLHCGHLHKYGCCEYRGVLMINSATFQAQTKFMKRQGVDPTPGHVPIVDLETKEVRAISFA